MNSLSSLETKVEYRKRENHTNTSALSRTNCKECVQCQTICDDKEYGKLRYYLSCIRRIRFSKRVSSN